MGWQDRCKQEQSHVIYNRDNFTSSFLIWSLYFIFLPIHLGQNLQYSVEQICFDPIGNVFSLLLLCMMAFRELKAFGNCDQCCYELLVPFSCRTCVCTSVKYVPRRGIAEFYIQLQQILPKFSKMALQMHLCQQYMSSACATSSPNLSFILAIPVSAQCVTLGFSFAFPW